MKLLTRILKVLVSFLVFLNISTMPLVLADPTKIGPLDPNHKLVGYKLSWFDEFDGKALDTNLWNYRTGPRGLSYSRPENISVENGRLVVELKKESFQGMLYSGGGIISQRRFKYGYYEARFKVPAGSGWHTSFWTRFYSSSNHEKPAGSDVEIDFCEQDSRNGLYFTNNIHRWLLNGISHHLVLGIQGVKPSSSLSSDFHTWGAEVTPTEIRFFFDGNLTREKNIERDQEGNPIELNDQNIWLTSVALPSGTNDFVDDTLLPAKVEFDWIRFYQE